MYPLDPALFYHITLFYPHIAEAAQKEFCTELKCGEMDCFTATQVNLNLSLNLNTKIPF